MGGEDQRPGCAFHLVTVLAVLAIVAVCAVATVLMMWRLLAKPYSEL